MLKLKPASSIVSAIKGRVSNSSERRPSVSMVQTAGKAPTKLTKPKIVDASRAPYVEKPASEKMVEEYYSCVRVPTQDDRGRSSLRKR